MKRNKDFSGDQKFVMSKKLRRHGFVVLEEISNDIIVKNTDINVIVRDFDDYEYEIVDIVKLINRLRDLRKNKIQKFVLGLMGVEEYGKKI